MREKLLLIKRLSNNVGFLARPAFPGKMAALLVALFCCFSIQAQTVSITGTVVDESEKPLTGVAVLVEGTRQGTITNAAGNYSINAPANATLTFTYLGYTPQTEKIGARKVINVIMSEDVANIDEVVVIGYGTSRKSDLTGSVVSVKAEDMNKVPVGNVTEMLRGQAAGVLVTLNNSESSAAPGGRSNILIRGSRSLSSSQSPLYIVNGMIVPHIDDLNPSDIASVEVLKDASSQAIYGSRASNGVILITTKKGFAGKTKVEFNSYYAIQRFTRNFEEWTPEEWVTLRYWAKANEGTAGIGTPDNINYTNVLNDQVMLDAWQNKKFTNWEKLMLTNAPQQKHDFTISGGGENLRISFGGGYYKQDGIVKKSGFEKGSLNTSIDYSPYKWLDLALMSSYTKSETAKNDADFNQVITMPVLAQAYDEDGELLREVSEEGGISPLWRNRERFEKQLDEYTTLNFGATFKIMKGLTYRFGANIRSGNRQTGIYRTKLYPGSTGEGSLSNFIRSSYLLDNVINYDLPIANKRHKINVALIQSVDQDLQRTTGFGFINSTSDMFTWNVAADAEASSLTRSISRTKSVSFAGRLQYNFMDRYLITASIRRDGASLFGPANKWANFPSAAFAWRINEEKFLKNTRWIHMLKLRLSYGVVGNWAIPAYRTLGVAKKYEYLFGDALAIGYLPDTNLVNTKLKWETTESSNLGLDFSIFKGRLSATLETYRTDTKDLLVNRTIPSITGYTKMWDNLGKTRSWGYEVTVNGKIVDKKDFYWNLGVNFSKQRNKIIAIDGRVDEDGKLLDDINNNWFIGKSINARRDYVFGGIWQTGQEPTENDYLPGSAKPVPGDIKILDYDGDGKITVDDQKIYEQDPQWYGSISTNLYWKGLDLSLEFYTVQGVTRQNPYFYAYNQGGNLTGKLNGMKVDYWTPENPSNTAPRPQFTASVSNFGVIGWQDASYFRLRFVTLGYTLPQKLTRKVLINKLRVYTTATNIFTLTKFKSYSPEKLASGYPEPQTLTLGINLTF